MLDLADLGKYRENNRIEAKKATGGFPKSLWESYSAFANTIGGIILLGVEEKADGSFERAGLKNASALLDEFWQKVNDKTVASKNILAPNDAYIDRDPEGDIVVINVPAAKAEDKPIYINRDIYNGSYCRNGEGDFHCTRDEVRLMLSVREEVMPDERLIADGALTDLNEETIEFYREKLAKRKPLWAKLSQEELLHKLGAIGLDPEGNWHPTAAGLLLFGKREAITAEFPSYFLDYRRYGRVNKLDRRITSADGAKSGNLCGFYFAVCAEVLESLRKSAREEVYPVFKEGLANALMHANYYAKRGLLVEQSEDVLTISNPGGLRLSIAEAKAGAGSELRNKNLSKMFKYIGIGREKSHGVAYIYDTWQQMGLPEPELYSREHRTVLSLCLPEREDTARAKRKKMLLDYLTEHVTLTQIEAAEYLHVAKDTAAKYLRELENEQLIVSARQNRVKIYTLRTKYL